MFFVQGCLVPIVSFVEIGPVVVNEKIFNSRPFNFYFPFRVGQLVEGQANNLWVAGSNGAPVLLFIPFMEFYKCIFGAMLQILIPLIL